jgi:hypothetical protein
LDLQKPHLDRPALALPVTPETLVRPPEGLFSDRWAIYISAVLLVALASYAYWLKTRSIFACQAQGYSVERYLAYCGGGNYADYEHGAFYYNLEPRALDDARMADVLVLGNSRIQIALSNDATADWFKGASAKYYLLGFSYNEDVAFNEDLLPRMNPRASVFIVNVDDFFEGRETAAAKTILNDPDARNRYEWKRFSQYLHQRICGAFPKLCGQKYVVFRSRESGAYYRSPHEEPVFEQNAVSYDRTVDRAAVSDSTARAVDFLERFTKGKCVILTNVPYPATKIGNLEAIAAGAGLPLVVPTVNGLNTSDGYHLDRPSADRWARAFLETAGPQIRSCLEKRRATPS